MRLSRFPGTALLCLVLAPPALAGAHAAGSPARDGAGRLMHAATVACHGLAERGVFCQPMSQARRQLWPGVGYYTRSPPRGSRPGAERRPG